MRRYKIKNGEIYNILLERGDRYPDEIVDLIEEAADDLSERLSVGDDGYGICQEYFGLEPDYIMELLEYTLI